MITEEKITSMALEAIDYSNDKCVSYTKGVSKVAEAYGLAPQNIENVCHSVNHQVFKHAFEKDKMAEFEIANHRDVVAIMNAPEREEHEIKVAFDNEIIVEENSSPKEKRADAGLSLGIKDEENIAMVPNLVEAAITNMQDINENKMQRDGNYAELYNTIRISLQEGIPLSEIRDVLVDSWKDVPAEEVEKLIESAVISLKQEGYVNPTMDTKLNARVNNKDVNPDSDLAQTANKILIDNEASYKLGFIKHHLMNDLLKHGKYATISEIQKQTSEDLFEKIVIKSGMEKDASVISKIMSNVDNGVHGAINATIGRGSYLNFTENAKELVGRALAGAASMALLGGGLQAVQKGGIEIRKAVIKKQLLKRYPELQKIDPQTYSDIYDSVVNINDDLLDSPFALQSIIRNHATYNAMDASTVKTLAGARKREGTFMESLISHAIAGTSPSGIRDKSQ